MIDIYDLSVYVVEYFLKKALQNIMIDYRRSITFTIHATDLPNALNTMLMLFKS